MAHLGHVGALARGSAWTSLTSPDQLGMSRIAPFAPVSSYSDTQGHLVHSPRMSIFLLKCCALLWLCPDRAQCTYLAAAA